MKNVLFAMVAALGLMVGTASAGELSYNNVTVGATHINTWDTLGVVVKGSALITDNVYLMGEIGYDHNNDFDTGLMQTRFGVGTKTSIADATDLYGHAYGLHGDVIYDWDTSLGDTWGYGAEVGLRTLVTDRFEVKTGFSHERYNALGVSDNYFMAGAAYSFSPLVAGTVDVRHAMDGNYQVMAGVRFQF